MKSETYPETHSNAPSKTKKSVKELVMLILTAVPLALGVAIVVLSVIGEMDLVLVGISITCLSLLMLIKKKS